ncbi:MAG: putative ATP-dependent DNA helicase [Prokaryotic dsDNA virus sp.]|nr:MAG: putative ATP-dependent DNA helicase [Prokaryotic dsDNA virus sp.]
MNPQFDLSKYTHPNLNGFELRPEYQWPAHIATIEHCRRTFTKEELKQGEWQPPWMHEPAVIDATVGAGKTINIGSMAKHVSSKGGKVLTLARQGELIEQNSADAWSMGCKCSIFSASLNQKSTSFPVVMGTEGTVSNYLNTTFGYQVDSEGERIKDDNGNFVGRWVPDVILIDECHHVDWQDLIKKFDDPKHETKNQYTMILHHFITMKPDVRIIGYTGSPYRGRTDIIVPTKSPIKGFWCKKLYTVPTMQLVELGYLVPPVFGFGDDDHKYDLHEWTPDGEQGAHDYSSKELQAMQRKIVKDQTRTQIIMEEVVERTKDDGGVLITCAGKKHCEQVSECLPDGSWGIVTDSTSTKERRRILNGAKRGDIKYVIQIGCLTTGVNVPWWRYCVILRRIGSLTLLTQLIGRVLRTLKPDQIEAGMVKDDAVVLDYTDTMESMGDIYDDPMLERAMAAKAKEDKRTQPCPQCQTENSMYAVRCIGTSDTEVDGRCGHFFSFSMCQGCNTMNAPSAQECRSCGATMIDPNSKLLKKHYTDADYKPVLDMRFEHNKSGGLSVIFDLDSTIAEKGIERDEVATEYYDPTSKDRAKNGRWWAFVRAHVNSRSFQRAIMGMRSVKEIIKNKAMFDKPTHITHRVNEKGFSIVNRRKFLSGREAR